MHIERESYPNPASKKVSAHACEAITGVKLGQACCPILFEQALTGDSCRCATLLQDDDLIPLIHDATEHIGDFRFSNAIELACNLLATKQQSRATLDDLSVYNVRR